MTVDSNSQLIVQQRQQLLEQELTRCLTTLKAMPNPPQRILLFGSLVSGKIGPWSDIDLVIVQRTELRFLDRLKEMIDLLQPQVGMDLLVYTPEEFEQMKHEQLFFQEEILAKGRILYEQAA